jgi:hypothetical protein
MGVKEINVKIETISCESGDWRGWCETVGFVVRRITRRETPASFEPKEGGPRPPGAFFLIEFDILDGAKRYSTTGFWAIDAQDHEPLAEPICTPVSLAEALSPERIHTELSVSEAKDRLLRFVQPFLRDWV